MKRILSGIQSSGQIHIGNYFGALKQHIEMQNDFECYYFIANLHALTTVKDPKLLQQNTLDVAIDYLALGLNPDKATLFVQSEIPAHAELAWMLATLTPTGLLDRAHAWKDAVSKKKKDPTVGLYTYPILMAADILLYEPDLVPVGQDQKQHIEITRDIAEKFNNTYTPTFKLPESYIKKDLAVIPGTDGQKMSKSYGNTITVFGSDTEVKKSIMGIVTDSKSVEDKKDPDTCNVFALYKLMADKNEIENLKDKYLSGGFGYGDAKKLLLEKFMNYFGDFRTKKVALCSNIDYVKEVLKVGNEKAANQANSVLHKAKINTGIHF